MFKIDINIINLYVHDSEITKLGLQIDSLNVGESDNDFYYIFNMGRYILAFYFFCTTLVILIAADSYIMIISRKDDNSLCQGVLITPKHVITVSVCVCYGDVNNTINVISFDTKRKKSKLHEIASVNCESIVLEKNETGHHFGKEISIIELKEKTDLPIQTASNFPKAKEILLYSTIQIVENETIQLMTVPFLVYDTESCKSYGIASAPYNHVCGRANVYRAPMPYLGSPVISTDDKLIGIIYEFQNDFTELSKILLSYNDLTRPNEFLKNVLKNEYSKLFQKNDNPLLTRPAAETSFQPDVQLSRLRRDPSHEPYLVHITLARDKSIKCFGALITSDHAVVPANCVCDKRDSPESFDVYGVLFFRGSLDAVSKPREIFCGNDYDGEDFNMDIKRTAILQLRHVMFDPIEIHKSFPKDSDPIFYTMSFTFGHSPLRDVKYRAKVSTSCGPLLLTTTKKKCIYTNFRTPIMGVPIVSLSEKLVGMVYNVSPYKDDHVFSYIDVTNTVPFLKYYIDETFFARFKPQTKALTHRDFAASYHWATLEQTKNLYDIPGDQSYLVEIKSGENLECSGALITNYHILTSDCACDVKSSDITIYQYEFIKRNVYFQYRAVSVNCFMPQKTAIIHLDVSLETPVSLIDHFPKPLERVYYTVYDHEKSIIVRVLATIESKQHCLNEKFNLDLNKFLCAKVITNNPYRRPIIGTPVLNLDNRLIGTVFFKGIGENKKMIFLFTDVTYISNNLLRIVDPKMLKFLSPMMDGLKEGKFSADVALPQELNMKLYDFSDDLPYLVFIKNENNTLLCPGTMITNTHILILASCACKLLLTHISVIAFENYQFGEEYVYNAVSMDCEPESQDEQNTGYLSAIITLVTNTFDPIRLAATSPTTYALYYTIFDTTSKNITKILFFVEDEVFCKQTQLKFYPGISTCGRVNLQVDSKRPTLGTPVISITNELVGLIFDIKTMENGRTVFTYTNVAANRQFLDSKIDKRLYRPSLVYNEPLYERAFAADVVLKPLQTQNLFDNKHDSPYLVFIREKKTRKIVGAGALITNGHILTAYTVVCEVKDLQIIEIITVDTFKYFEPISIDVKAIQCEDAKKNVIGRSAIIELVRSIETPVKLIDKSVDLSLHEYIYYTIFESTLHKIAKVIALHEDKRYCNNYKLHLSSSSTGCGKILKVYDSVYPVIGTPVLTTDNKLIGIVYETNENKNGAVFAYTNVNQIRTFLNQNINRKSYRGEIPKNITLPMTAFSADVPLHKRKVKVDNPFLVLLKPRHSDVPHCAGALIAPTHILTLSRCVCMQANDLIEIHTSSTYLFHKTPVLYSKEVICESADDSNTNAKAKIAIVKIETPRYNPIEMSFMSSKSGSVSYIVPFNKERIILVKSLPALRAFQADCRKDEVDAFNNTNNCLKIIWDDGSELYHGSPVINNNKLIGLVYDFPTNIHNDSTFAYIDLIYVQKFLFDKITEEELSTFLDFDDEDEYLLATDGFTSSRIDIFSRPTKLYSFNHYNSMSFSYLVLIHNNQLLTESCHGVYISLRHVMTAAKCICSNIGAESNKIQIYHMYYRQLYIYREKIFEKPDTLLCPNENDHPSATFDINKGVAVFTLDESLTVMPDGDSRIHLAHRAFVPVFDNTTVYYLYPSRTKEGLVYGIQVTTALIVDEQDCIDNNISVSESEKLCARTFNDKRKPVLGSPLLTEDNDVFGIINVVAKGINSNVFYIGYIHINNNIRFINRALASI